MEEAAKAQLSQHIGRNLGPFLLGWVSLPTQRNLIAGGSSTPCFSA